MTFSREQYQAAIGGNDDIPVRLRSYFKQRFQQKAFARLAKAYAQRADETGLTKSRLASLLGRDKSQINRLLAHPSNMTMDVYSELALALNFEPELSLCDLSEDPRHNFVHQAYRHSEHEVQSLTLVNSVANRAANVVSHKKLEMT